MFLRSIFFLILRSSERGVNSILTTVFDQFPEEIEFFAWWHLFQLVARIIFKKELSKTDLPFKFCKIGLKNTLFIFGRKNGRLLFCLLQLCPILAYFF